MVEIQWSCLATSLLFYFEASIVLTFVKTVNHSARPLARSARMVGYAMTASHGKDVPAHRVVNRKGLLTGKHHFEGTNLMQQLLENEGLEVINNQIQQFDSVFWDPAKEL